MRNQRGEIALSQNLRNLARRQAKLYTEAALRREGKLLNG